MKRFIAVLMLASGLVVAGGLTAAPVDWTLAPVTFSNNDTLSGSFTYDSATNTYTNIQIGYFDGTTTNLLSHVDFGSSSRLIVSTNGQNNSPAADLFGFTPILSNGGGNVSYTAYVGTYNTGTSNVNQVANYPATLFGVGTAAVPTLSQWAQLMLALMVIGVAWHFHNNRQNSF